MPFNMALDKRGYSGNIFLISPQKHMLWLLIRSTMMRHFEWISRAVCWQDPVVPSFVEVFTNRFIPNMFMFWSLNFNDPTSNGWVGIGVRNKGKLCRRCPGRTTITKRSLQLTPRGRKNY